MKQRKVLVIFSNRWNRSQKLRFLELSCDSEGNILRQHKLKTEPRRPIFDEVWENDEGRAEFDACHRFHRKYGHKLQRKA